jgi:hypothetical protein
MHTVATALFTFTVKNLSKLDGASFLTPEDLKALNEVYKNIF